MLSIEILSKQLLLDIADFIYITIDINQKVTLINKKGCEILGYSEEEIIDKNWFDNFLPKEVAMNMKSIFVKQIAENKKPVLSKIYPILTKEGEERLISWHNTIFNDEEGDIRGLLCSGEDITEKIEAQRALKDSEAKYSSVVESSNDGIAITQEGKLVFVNNQFAEMMDKSPEDLVESVAAKVVSDSDRDMVIDYTQRRIAGDKTIPNKYEINLVTSKGIEIPVEITASVIEYKGKPASVSILRDITERKEAQKALEDNERKFRKIFNHSNDGHVLRNLDGIILEVNPKFLELFGYNRNEVVSKNILDLRLIEDSNELGRLMRKVGKEGFIQVETEVRKKDGTLFLIELNGITFDLEGEQVVFNILKDITESKKNVSALIENEKKYRMLLESLPQKIFQKDANLKYVSCNENYAKDLKIQSSDINGKTDFDFFLSELAEKYRADDKRIMKEGKTETIVEKYMQNGKESTVETTKIPLYNEKGDCVGVIGIFHDISERVKTELALQESEEKYRSFVQNFQGIAFRRTMDFKPIFFHGAVEEITGYSEEDFVSTSLTWDKLIHPEDIVEIKETIEKLSNVPDLSIEREYRIIRKNGEIKWVYETVRNTCDEKGKPIHVQGCIRDYTERIATEQKIKDNEEKFRALYNEMVQAYALYEAIYDKKGDIEDAILKEVNSEYEKLVDKKREEIIGKKISEIYPNLKKLAVDQIAFLGRSAITGEVVKSEYYNKDVGKWLLAKSFSPMKNHAAVLFEDITEKRKIEKELEKERETTKQYLDIANVILLAVDKNENVKLINKKGCELLGYESEDIIGKNWFYNFLPKRVHDKTKESFQELLVGKIAQFQHRENFILTKDGEERLIAWDFSYIKNEEGTIDSILGSGRDITERKRIEKEAKASEEKYRSIFNNANETIFLLKESEDGRFNKIVGANRQAVKMYGYSIEELLKMSPNDFNATGYYVETDETLTEFLKERRIRFERTHKTKKGKIIDVEISSQLFELGGETVSHAMIQDITERKKAQKELNQSKYDLRERVKELTTIHNISKWLMETDKTIGEVLGKITEVIPAGWQYPDCTAARIVLEEQQFVSRNFIESQWKQTAKISLEDKIVGEIEVCYTESKPDSYEGPFLHEERNLIEEIARQISVFITRKKAEEKIKESEKKFHTLYDEMKQAYALYKVIYDDKSNPQDGKIIELNPEYENLVKIKREEIIGKKISELYPKLQNQNANIIKLLGKSVKTGETITLEYYNEDIGKWIFAKSFSPMKDHVAVLYEDITEKRKIESNLIANELKFRSIFNHSNDGYVLRTVEGIVLEANPKFLELFGYEASEVIFNNIRLINVYETDEDHISRKKEIAKKGFAQFETLATRKDGSLFPMEVNAIKLMLADEEMVFVIFRDITKRKEAEEKIKSSEALYKTLFENTGTGMFLCEEDFTITLCNKLVLEKSGLSQDEITGKKWTEFMLKEEIETVSKAIKRMDKDFIPPLNFETSNFDMLGKNKTLLVTISIIPETNQRIASLIDISEQKELEEELKQSEEKFRSIFNHSLDGYILRDGDGIVMEYNPTLLEMFGYDKEDLDGVNIAEFEQRENIDSIQKMKEMLASKGRAFLETRFIRKDKTWVSVEKSAIKFNLAEREVVFCIFRDISERKKAEKELKISEERLRTMFENIPLAISTNSSNGELIDINPAFLNLYGYNNKDECFSTPFTNRWFNIKDRERFYNSLSQRNYVKNFEAKQYRKDGSEFWVSITAGAQPDISGEKKYFNARREITFEKQREDKLKKQTLRYHLKESQLYLSEEEQPYISKEALIDLLRVGYNGLVLSRLPETEWKKGVKSEFDFLRIAEKEHLKTISSNLSKIEQLIEELPNKHVIVIDRLDYLISKNGFETTLFFIFRLIDIAYLSNHIIIVSLDPVTLNEKERKSLRKEMQMIESLSKTTLPEELIEILEFVHKRNIIGDKPSYTDIVETFSISRPTARKRIKNLINEEFIFESTKGRSKVLGITEKGKVIFN